MAAEIKKEIELEIAHVLFVDMVGYSKLSVNEQRARVDELNQIVRASQQYQKAEAAPSLRTFVLPEKIEGEMPPSKDPAILVFPRAMTDSQFKSKLMTNPKQAVRDMGVAVPDAIDIRVYQNTPNKIHVVLPANPGESELSDADLEAVAGGKAMERPTPFVGTSGKY